MFLDYNKNMKLVTKFTQTIIKKKTMIRLVLIAYSITVPLIGISIINTYTSKHSFATAAECAVIPAGNFCFFNDVRPRFGDGNSFVGDTLTLPAGEFEVGQQIYIYNKTSTNHTNVVIRNQLPPNVSGLAVGFNIWKNTWNSVTNQWNAVDITGTNTINDLNSIAGINVGNINSYQSVSVRFYLKADPSTLTPGANTFVNTSFITSQEGLNMSDNSTFIINYTPVCGNNILDSGEQCDDGNTLNGDGCSSSCQNEPPPSINISLFGTNGSEVCGIATARTDDGFSVQIQNYLNNHIIEYRFTGTNALDWTEISPITTTLGSGGIQIGTGDIAFSTNLNAGETNIETRVRNGGTILTTSTQNITINTDPASIVCGGFTPNTPAVISDMTVQYFDGSSLSANLLGNPLFTTELGRLVIGLGDYRVSANFSDAEDNILQINMGYGQEAPLWSFTQGDLSTNLADGIRNWDYLNSNLLAEANTTIRFQVIDGVVAQPLTHLITNQTIDIVVDRTPPEISNISFVDNQSINSPLNLSFDVSDVKLASYQVSIVGHPGITGCSEQINISSPNLSNGTKNCSIDMSSLANGTYTVLISATDALGRSAAVSRNVILNNFTALQTPTVLGWNVLGTVETSTTSIYPNTIPVDISCTQPIRITNQNSLAFNWSTPDVIANLKFQRELTFPDSSIAYFYSTTPYTAFGGFAGQGNYTNRIRSFIDSNNNSLIDTGETLSSWSNACSIIFDNTPTLSSFTTPSDNQVINGGAITFTGNTVDNFSVSQIVLQYRLVPATTWTTFYTINITPDWQTNVVWSYSWTPPASGTYDFKVYGIDLAQNIEGSGYVYGVIYNSGAPTVSVGVGNNVSPTQNMPYLLAFEPALNIPDNTSPAHNSVVSGTLPIYATVQSSIPIDYVHLRLVKEGNVDSPVGCDITQSGFNICPDQRYKYNYYGNVTGTDFIISTIDTTLLDNGTYWIIIGAVDQNGLRNSPSFNQDPRIRIVINNSSTPFIPDTPTGLAFTSPVLTCGSTTSATNITVAWNASAGASLYNLQIQIPNSTVSSVTISENSYIYNLNHGVGIYRFRVRSTANNQDFSAWSEWCNITLNNFTPAPTITIDQPAYMLVSGFSCGIGNLVQNDMLRIIVNNWDASYTLQGSYLEGGGSYNNWFNLTNGTMTNGVFIETTDTAIYLWLNDRDWMPGPASWRVRVIDSNGDQIGTTVTFNFQVTTDPTHLACGQSLPTSPITVYPQPNLVLNEGDPINIEILADSNSQAFLVMQMRVTYAGYTPSSWVDIFTIHSPNVGILQSGNTYDLFNLNTLADTTLFNEGVYEFRYFVYNTDGEFSNSGSTENAFSGVNAHYFTMTINNVSPQVNLSTAATMPVLTGQTINFNGSFMDPSYINLGNFIGNGDDSPWSIQIDYGDGDVRNLTSASIPNSLTIPSKTYSTAGTYTVTLRVTESSLMMGEGQMGTASVNVSVTNPPTPLTLSLTASPSVFTAPGGTIVTSNILGAVGGVNYLWSGICAGASGATHSMNFTIPGTYICGLNVMDSLGRIANATVNIVVNSPIISPPLAILNFNLISSAGNTIQVPGSTQIIPQITDGSGSYAYNWSNSCSGMASTSTIIINSIGSYLCSLTITDLGSGVVASRTIVVNGVAGNVNNNNNNNINNQNNNDVNNANTNSGLNTSSPISAPVSSVTRVDGVLGTSSCVDSAKKNVSGFVYLDENDDGLFSINEKVFADIQIRIFDGKGNLVATTLTDANGKYSVSVCQGSATIKLNKDDIPVGYELKLSNTLNIEVGRSDMRNQNFALVALNSGILAGFNWWLCFVPLLCLILILIFASIISMINKAENKNKEIIRVEENLSTGTPKVAYHEV